MYELDFLAVGDGQRSGDAIALRFTRPDTGTYAHVIIDAGFAASGEALVDHVPRYYGTQYVDLAIVTHPDGDHIGGMGNVLRGLSVGELWVHRLGAHGGAGLPAADAVSELTRLAAQRDVRVLEPFAGTSAFGGCLTVLSPDESWYESLVGEETVWKTATSGSRLIAAARRAGQRIVSALPIEVPFDDAGGTNPRNNTSAVILLDIENHKALFTGDAGVLALEASHDYVLDHFGPWIAPNFVQVPHHGSRHNGSSAVLDLLLGAQGQSECRTAFISVTSDDPDHPSPRIVNAYKRRGCRVFQTAGKALLHHSSTAPDRGWSAATPLGPMDESGEED
jgi:beta-lactamase superfamily II metal-dependent hydrolase